jgi:hypothetical protein
VKPPRVPRRNTKPRPLAITPTNYTQNRNINSLYTPRRDNASNNEKDYSHKYNKNTTQTLKINFNKDLRNDTNTSFGSSNRDKNRYNRIHKSPHCKEGSFTYNRTFCSERKPKLQEEEKYNKLPISKFDIEKVIEPEIEELQSNSVSVSRSISKTDDQTNSSKNKIEHKYDYIVKPLVQVDEMLNTTEKVRLLV